MKYLKFIFKTLRSLVKYLLHNPEELTLSNIKAYFQGNWRLLRIDSQPEHVRDQFYYRLVLMNPICYRNGFCPCKCPFPAKQFSDSPCEKDCYPFFLEKKDWEIFVSVKSIDLPLVREKAKILLGDKAQLLLGGKSQTKTK